MPLPRRLLTSAVTLALALSAPAVAPGAATAAAGGRLTVTNSDVLPSSSAVVLSKIQNVADSSQRMHDRAVLRLTNTGTASLTVSALSTTGAFTITSPWRLPFILSSGSSVDVTVAFTATTGDWHTGRATLSWSDDQPRTTSVGLTGWWQKYSEKGLEPRLGDLVRNFGYGTVMPTAIYSRGAYRAFSSDEVLSPYWTLLDPAQPARITQIAAWRGYPTNVVVRTFPRGSSSQTSQVFSGLKNDAQSAFPRNTSWGRGTATFPAVGPVGLKVDQEFSDPALNADAVDRTAGCTAAQCGHHLRVFRARQPDGTLIPGAYLMAQDFSGINYDYQDNVFLLENLAPA